MICALNNHILSGVMRNQIKKEDALKIVLAALLIYKETGVTSVSRSSFPLSRTKYIKPPSLQKSV